MKVSHSVISSTVCSDDLQEGKGSKSRSIKKGSIIKKVKQFGNWFLNTA